MTGYKLEQKSDSADSQADQVKQVNRKSRRWLRRLIVIAVILIVTLTAGFFVVRHLWGWDIGHYCIQKALDSRDANRGLLLYRVALLWDSSRDDARINRVTLFIQTKKLKKALRECDRWIKAEPDDAEAYAQKAKILLQQEKPDQALAQYDKFITIQPEKAQGYIGRADVYYQQKDFDKALAECNKAIERGGGILGVLGHEAYAQRAAVQLKLGNYDKAIADYSQAIEIETEAAEAHEKWALETAKRAPRFDASMSILLQRRFLAHSYANRANAYSRADRYDEAMADIKKALELDPENKEFTLFYRELKEMQSKQ